MIVFLGRERGIHLLEEVAAQKRAETLLIFSQCAGFRKNYQDNYNYIVTLKYSTGIVVGDECATSTLQLHSTCCSLKLYALSV